MWNAYKLFQRTFVVTETYHVWQRTKLVDIKIIYNSTFYRYALYYWPENTHFNKSSVFAGMQQYILKRWWWRVGQTHWIGISRWDQKDLKILNAMLAHSHKVSWHTVRPHQPPFIFLGVSHHCCATTMVQISAGCLKYLSEDMLHINQYLLCVRISLSNDASYAVAVTCHLYLTVLHSFSQ